jgi:peptidoglycan-N-acetylglucosamine deacetylase
MRAALAAGAAIAGMTWAVRGRSSSVFGPSVYKGCRGRKAIALTFDDGPSAGTLEILDILTSYGAAATFFQCGMNVERAPEHGVAIRRAGHEIGNHSYAHVVPALRSAGFIADEFSRAQDALRRGCCQTRVTEPLSACMTAAVPNQTRT